MEPASTASTKAALLLLAALFAVTVYRAATEPATADEAYSYDRFVRPPIGEVLAAYDPGNHLLYTLLAKRSIGFFRLSEFSLRLPSLLAGALYLWAVWLFSRRIPGPRALSLAMAAALALNPWTLDLYRSAWGYGLPVALALCALDLMLARPLPPRNLNLAAVCLGLAVADSPRFLLPAAALAAVGLMVFLRRGPTAARGLVVFAERFMVPAVATTFILLVLLLSHARSAARPGAPTRAEEAGARSLAQALRAIAGPRPVRIAASPSLEPLMNFYRARYRLGNWERVAVNSPAASFDYYVLVPPDAAWAEQKPARVLARAAGLVLAQ